MSSQAAQKKLEERHQKIIRTLLSMDSNRHCMECQAPGPTYVNCFNQTFICQRCSGIVREMSHRVKNISASVFTPEEIKALQEGGNEVNRKKYMEDFNMNVDPKDNNAIREVIRMKYVQNRWKSASVAGSESFSNTANNYQAPSQPLFSAPISHQASFNADSLSRQQSSFMPHQDLLGFAPSQTPVSAPAVSAPLFNMQQQQLQANNSFNMQQQPQANNSFNMQQQQAPLSAPVSFPQSNSNNFFVRSENNSFMQPAVTPQLASANASFSNNANPLMPPPAQQGGRRDRTAQQPQQQNSMASLMDPNPIMVLPTNQPIIQQQPPQFATQLSLQQPPLQTSQNQIKEQPKQNQADDKYSVFKDLENLDSPIFGSMQSKQNSSFSFAGQNQSASGPFGQQSASVFPAGQQSASSGIFPTQNSFNFGQQHVQAEQNQTPLFGSAISQPNPFASLPSTTSANPFAAVNPFESKPAPAANPFSSNYSYGSSNTTNTAPKSQLNAASNNPFESMLSNPNFSNSTASQMPVGDDFNPFKF